MTLVVALGERGLNTAVIADAVDDCGAPIKWINTQKIHTGIDTPAAQYATLRRA